MIITISRQFGSGGREVGKRLADYMNLAYYDKELVSAIAEKCALNEGYVSSVLENGGFNHFAFSFARTMPIVTTVPDTVTDVLVQQQNVIKALGDKGDCVIVGRCADVILSDYNPVKVFVYADEPSKIARCRERAEKGENLSDKQIIKTARKIDKGRAKLCELLSSGKWGDKDSYDILLNTSHRDIKALIPPLAELIRALDSNRKA